MPYPDAADLRSVAPVGAERLAIAVVTYQCRDLVDRCLDSIRRHAPSGDPPSVAVVDNGSTDGTVELIRARHPAVTVVEAGGNLGFAAANNLAIAMGDSEYVLVLNPDTELHAGTLSTMLEVMDRHPRAGMAGCRLIRPDGSFDHAARRSFPTVTGALGHFTRLGRGDRAPAALAQYRAPDHHGPGPVDAINGAFMLIRRSALREVGAFDEGYWLYMEDLDLCYRFMQHGWEVRYEPSVTATHVKGGSSGPQRAARQNRAFHYGMFRFYRKFYAPTRPAAANLAVYAGIGFKLCLSLAVSATRRRRARGRVL